MKKPIDEKLDQYIGKAVKDSGRPVEQVEEIASFMITYVNSGAKYGNTPEGFYRWYTEQGGKL